MTVYADGETGETTNSEDGTEDEGPPPPPPPPECDKNVLTLDPNIDASQTYNILERNEE